MLKRVDPEGAMSLRAIAEKQLPVNQLVVGYTPFGTYWGLIMFRKYFWVVVAVIVIADMLLTAFNAPFSFRTFYAM
jgi:hypothetical protein